MACNPMDRLFVIRRACKRASTSHSYLGIRATPSTVTFSYFSSEIDITIATINKHVSQCHATAAAYLCLLQNLYRLG